MNIIQQLEAEQAAKIEAKRKLPDFSPGDTVRVNVTVKEGNRTRVQAYEGVCIARSGGGINESFTVRKISYGEGVERVFPVYSPLVEGVEIVRRGKVRRAKLYYLRDRRGKAARIFESTSARTRKIEATERDAALEAKNAREAERVAAAEALAAEVAQKEAAEAWLRRYRERLAREGRDEARRMADMQAVNPCYVLRNYLAELAITDANQGDTARLEDLLRVVQNPFRPRPGWEAYAGEAPAWGRCLSISCSS